MKKIRKKRCVICNEQFTPLYSSLQKTCNVEHALQYNKLIKAKNKSALNEMRNEKLKEDSLSELIKQTKTEVHAYIRLRDKGKPCISCGGKWHSKYHAGHCFDSKQHNGIRFDLFNINGQCPWCNNHLAGNYEEYRLRLPKRIGKENYDSLAKRANIALRVAHHWSKFELKEIQKNVRALTIKLKKEISKKKIEMKNRLL